MQGDWVGQYVPAVTVETTGIGSVPFVEVEAALRYSFAHDIPFLPQLVGERMVVAPGADAALPAFIAALASRKPRGAKVQIVGPVTLAKHGSVRVDLTSKALQLVGAVASTGVHPMIFVDEPALGGGPFVELSAMLTALKASGATTGVHCCGDANWGAVLSMPALDVVSFDAVRSFETIDVHTAAFRARGGVLGFGIDGPSFTLPARPGPVLVTATCGLSGRSVEQAEAQLSLLRALRAPGP